MLNERGDAVGSATSAADGTYAVAGLTPGTYTVAVAGRPSLTTEVVIADGTATVHADLGPGRRPG
ncbi:hypothetical protein [Streptomyces sp. NPDC056160]|uniref:hypothetical protein n=1 Tax=Streptomyces sp. NPDC056160 TaxID=3345731 RepID=UPI0035E13408